MDKNKITKDNIKIGDVVEYIGSYSYMPKVGARGKVLYVRQRYIGVAFEEDFERGWSVRGPKRNGREFVFIDFDDPDSVSKLKLVSKYKWIKMK